LSTDVSEVRTASITHLIPDDGGSTSEVHSFVYFDLNIPREQVARQKALNQMVASILRILSALNRFVYAIFSVSVIPKYLNFSTSPKDHLLPLC
jgi:hypothetical protein